MWGRGLGAGGAVIALIVMFLVRAGNKHSTGEEHLAAAREMITELPSYRTKTDYVDWLVVRAHDECFSDSYSQEFGRRGRGGRISVDEYQYINDLFDHMTAQAESDREKEIATELADLRKKILSNE
jgi:hypothetical protein